MPDPSAPRGSLRLEMEAETLQLARGELYVVSRGVRHNPVADVECHVMLVDRRSTHHTGDLESTLIRPLDEQLRPLD